MKSLSNEIGYCDQSAEDVRRVAMPFDITKLKRCIYCGTTDIDYYPVMRNWECNVCGAIWEE